jgi:hypothetical protein
MVAVVLVQYKPAITVQCKNDRRQPHKGINLCQYCCEIITMTTSTTFVRHVLSSLTRPQYLETDKGLFPHDFSALPNTNVDSPTLSPIIKSHERQAPGLLGFLIVGTLSVHHFAQGRVFQSSVVGP